MRPPPTDARVKEGEILVILGIFLALLASVVAVGTFWAEETVPALISLAAAGILGLIAGGMVWRGRGL